jgi:hypothetical protein
VARGLDGVGETAAPVDRVQVPRVTQVKSTLGADAADAVDAAGGMEGGCVEDDGEGDALVDGDGAQEEQEGIPGEAAAQEGVGEAGTQSVPVSDREDEVAPYLLGRVRGLKAKLPWRYVDACWSRVACCRGLTCHMTMLPHDLSPHHLSYHPI